MKEEEEKKEIKVIKKYGSGSSAGAVYGLGFIGAFVYYIQGSQTFMEGVIGFLKALVWPAFLIYRVFELLKM
jgi:hypothetical protein